MLTLSQPPRRSTLRIHKAPCGLGSRNACALPAAEGRGVRALVLAGYREILLAPVPGSGGVASFLVPSTGEEAQGLFGAPAAGDSLRHGRRPRDCARRLDFALGFAPPAQVSQGSGFCGAAWVRWGTFSVYGVKLHLICATNGVPLCYELTPANVPDVSLAEELLAEAALGDGVARRLSWGTWPTEARP